MIHRDLKPDNVLCCGFGDEEIFKIADFGVARPAGVATFTGAVVGTPGFVAPELAAGDREAIGPWSDIFSLAAVSSTCSPARSTSPRKNAGRRARQGVQPRRAAASSTTPRPLARAPRERAGLPRHRLRARRRHRGQDREAARTAPTRSPRCSCPGSGRVDAAEALDRRSASTASATTTSRRSVQRWTWTTLRNPAQRPRSAQRRVGRRRPCMAATSRGLAFWNGAELARRAARGFPNPTGIRFVQRVAAGSWLVGGDDATFATLTTDGVTEVRRLAGRRSRASIASAATSTTSPCSSARPRRPADALRALRQALAQAPAAARRRRASRRSRASRTRAGSSPAAAPTAAASPRSTRRSTGRWSASRRPSVRAFLAARASPIARSGLATGADGAVMWRQGSATSRNETRRRRATTSRPPASTRWAAAGPRAPGASGCAAARRASARRARAVGLHLGRPELDDCRSCRCSPTSAS